MPLPASILQTAVACRAPDRQGKVRDIYEFGEMSDGTVYIIMELLCGVALSELMRRSPGGLSSAALPICKQIAQAMAAAHHKGIVHRERCSPRQRSR